MAGVMIEMRLLSYCWRMSVLKTLSSVWVGLKRPHLVDPSTMMRRWNIFIQKYGFVYLRNSTVVKIKKLILKATSPQASGSNELDQLQVQLTQALVGKRFLLVLDDVWDKNFDHWKLLQAPFMVGDKGSRIIVTTSVLEIASMMAIVNTTLIWSIYTMTNAGKFFCFMLKIRIVINIRIWKQDARKLQISVVAYLQQRRCLVAFYTLNAMIMNGKIYWIEKFGVCQLRNVTFSQYWD